MILEGGAENGQEIRRFLLAFNVGPSGFNPSACIPGGERAPIDDGNSPHPIGKCTFHAIATFLYQGTANAFANAAIPPETKNRAEDGANAVSCHIDK